MFKKMISKVKIIINDKDERNLFKNIFLAFLVKGLSLFLSVFSLPLYIKYFDNEEILGIWYTILSVLSWINICDLGLGNGLRNYFTKKFYSNEIEEGKKYVSSTYISSFFIVFPIVIICLFGVNYIDWHKFLNLSSDLILKKDICLAIKILVIGIGINFILKNITSIIYAIQKSSLNNIISLVVSVMPLLYILIAPSGTVGDNIINLSIVHIFSINLPLLIATIIIFCTICKKFKPSLKLWDKKIAKKMLSLGLKFFGAQIFFMFLMSTNEIFITKIYSPANVVEYNAYYKIFMSVGSLFMLALTPIWSKVTKDLTEKKYTKIKNTNKVLYLIAIISSVFEFLLVFVLQWIFDIWLKESSFAVEYGVAFTFALFGSLYIFNIVLTTLANAINELKTQMFFYGAGALLKIPVIVLMGVVNTHWINVVLYNCVVLFAFCIFQLIWVEKKINKLIISEEENE